MADPRPPRPQPPRRAIDPRALMRIKSLQLRARAAVEGFVKGMHRTPYHGFSVEFSEYRQYTPGDDPRYLDWKLFARSDRYHIKRFEDETNLRCTLVVDTSRSMGYGSGAYTKSDYARTAAATVAYFLTRQRDAVGLLTFEDRITEYLPPRHRPGHLRRLMALLDREPQGKATDLARLARAGRRHGPEAGPGRPALRPPRPGRHSSRPGSATSGRAGTTWSSSGCSTRPRSTSRSTPRPVPRRRVGPRRLRRPRRRPGRLPPPVRRARRRGRARPAPTWGSSSTPCRPTGRSDRSSSTSSRPGCRGRRPARRGRPVGGGAR